MDVRAAKDEHRDALMALPNVVGVGIGRKVTGGEPLDTLVIKVFVSRKVPLEELAADERVPTQLGGIPTDVEELGPLAARDQRQG